MKLPANVLTKLCLAGAVATAVTAVGCESARNLEKQAPVTAPKAVSRPAPGAAPIAAETPPAPVTTPEVFQPSQAQKSTGCGPCGQG
jgi:hypothetical protein